ncbi:MAG: transglycosylase SLT domain-containing protein [Bacteroidota bacterium]
MTRKMRKAKDRRYVVLSLPKLPKPIRNASLLALLVVGSNLLTHQLFNPSTSSDPTPLEYVRTRSPQERSQNLYLLEKAAEHIDDLDDFEAKVRDVSQMLEIPPEWLMAVMYAESAFDPGVANHQGSGAVGLIQFMPATAESLQVSAERLKRMEAVQQLEYVYLYLQQIRERFGEFDSLTDLYLSILYPKARKQDYCYTLYAKPTIAYRQNSILDEDKDGRVTITDVDRRMKRLFPTAYRQDKETS